MFYGRENTSIFSDDLTIKLQDEMYPSFIQRRYLPFLPKSSDARKGKHESAFVRMSTHKKYKFNLCKKIAADFEFFYKAHKVGLDMTVIPLTLSRVSSGGISDTKRIDSILERWITVDKNLKVNFFIFI